MSNDKFMKKSHKLCPVCGFAVNKLKDHVVGRINGELIYNCTNVFNHDELEDDLE